MLNSEIISQNANSEKKATIRTSTRKLQSFCPNCFMGISNTFVFIFIWSQLWTSVSGGICWLSVDDEGTCSGLIQPGLTQQECCSMEHPTVGWTAEDNYDPSRLFFLAYLSKERVPNCAACHHKSPNRSNKRRWRSFNRFLEDGTCDNVHCPSDKKCRIRNGVAQCMCSPDCRDHSPLQRERLCGTDGHTYRSECAMLRSNCRRSRQAQVDYYGSRCQHSCARVTCGDGESCITDQNGKPHCIPCDPNARCHNAVPDKICGADGVTYPNMCVFQRASCMNGRSIGLAYKGQCDKSLTCETVSCPSGMTCLLNTARNSPRCTVCNRDCHSWLGQNVVCGTDGNTYDTWCHLQERACAVGVVIETQHYGECGNDPTVNSHELDYAQMQSDDYYYTD